MRKICAIWLAAATLPLLAWSAFGQGKIDLLCVDDAAHGYATFQSHNQKVVQNRHGLFMTHLRTRNEAYTAQMWRLSRSTDGGATFETVYEAVNATNPPVIETDAAGVLYLGRPDFVDNNAYLYRFAADTGFREPVITTIPGAAAGKYAMHLDEKRGQLYFFAHNNTFHVVGLDGTVRSSVVLIKDGPHAALQYPLLSMSSDGVLHAAWTTVKHGEYLYWDIHHMCSPDGGATWRNLDGAELTPPIVADDTGPAMRISGDDEFDAHTWLSSFMVKGGKLHFLYLTQTTPPRQHYVRYDVALARRDIDIAPEFRGETLEIQSLDGFFATPDETSESPLYCLGSKGGCVVCLISRDNGATWNDHAVSKPVQSVYALGGCRVLTPDRHIIGSFTNQPGDHKASEFASRVYFIRAVG